MYLGLTLVSPLGLCLYLVWTIAGVSGLLFLSSPLDSVRRSMTYASPRNILVLPVPYLCFDPACVCWPRLSIKSLHMDPHASRFCHCYSCKKFFLNTFYALAILDWIWYDNTISTLKNISYNIIYEILKYIIKYNYKKRHSTLKKLVSKAIFTQKLLVNFKIHYKKDQVTFI